VEVAEDVALQVGRVGVVPAGAGGAGVGAEAAHLLAVYLLRTVMPSEGKVRSKL
jgi:hypothetical protein